jgi:hypothetical protein
MAAMAAKAAQTIALAECLMIMNVESFKNMTISRSFSVQALSFLQKANLFFIIFSVRRGLFVADCDSSANLLLQMSCFVRAVASVHPGTFSLSCLAVLNGEDIAEAMWVWCLGHPERFLGGVGVMVMGRPWFWRMILL